MNSQASPSRLLKHLAQIAANYTTIAQLLPPIAQALGEAFRAEGCVVVSLKPLIEQVEVGGWLTSRDITTVHCAPSGQAYLQQRLSYLHPLISDVSSTRMYAVSEVGHAAESIWHHLHLPGEPLSAATVLEVPSQFQGAGNGLISLMRSPAYPWTSVEIEKLEIVSQQIAAMFSQLHLQQQIEQQLQYQAVVNQLTRAIRQTSNLMDVLHLATEGTTQALRAQRGLLLRIKYADPLFRSHATEEVPKARVTVVCEWNQAQTSMQSHPTPEGQPATVLSQSFWLSECELCQHAFSRDRPLAIDNQQIWLNGLTSHHLSQFFDLDHLHSLLITRLESQGTVLGFLLVQDSTPRNWQSADLELMDLVSAQVSNAIIQTETLRQVQSLVEKRTAELQQSLTIQAKLYERTRQQVEQLRHLNQVKDEFLDTVSHELRTPLTSMALAIRMLRQVGMESDRSQRYLDILEQQCAQETSLVNDLLALRELESKQATIQLEEINLVDLVQEQAQAFRQRWAAEGLSLELEFPSHPVKIQSDRDSLNRILLELLTNAGKYSTPNTCIYFKLLYRRESSGDQVILSLTNTGSGIPPEELPFVFDRFRRCQGATQNAIQGTGLGLALVQVLVQHLNGTISASSSPIANSPDWETCFSVILPQSFQLARP